MRLLPLIVPLSNFETKLQVTARVSVTVTCKFNLKNQIRVDATGTATGSLPLPLATQADLWHGMAGGSGRHTGKHWHSMIITGSGSGISEGRSVVSESSVRC